MAVDAQPAGETTTTPQAGAALADAASPTLAELVRIVETTAASDEWIGRVRLRSDRRWYERIYHRPEYDVWVISWLPGQSTGFHDHGASSGAFIVAAGERRSFVRTGIHIWRGRAHCAPSVPIMRMMFVTFRVRQPSAFTHIHLRSPR